MPDPVVFPERKEINVITISDDDMGMSSRSLVKTENDVIAGEPDDDAGDNEKATNMPEIDPLIRRQLLANLASIFVRDLIDGHERQCATCQPEFATTLELVIGRRLLDGNAAQLATIFLSVYVPFESASGLASTSVRRSRSSVFFNEGESC